MHPQNKYFRLDVVTDMQNTLVRKAAIANGLKRYFTGKPCKHGHVAERLSHNGSCLECHREAGRRWREDNPGYDKRYYQAKKRSRGLQATKTRVIETVLIKSANEIDL